jgi:N,N'-diacetyllegionaminate synthase
MPKSLVEPSVASSRQPSIQIGPSTIGPSRPAYVIAEAGVNHDGSLEIARELIQAAAAAEANAVKFQVFSADRLVTRQAPSAGYQQRAGEGLSQHDMLARLELQHAEFAELADYARVCGIEFLATPFSPADVEFISSLGLRAIKLASPDIVNRPLLEAIAECGVPVIASTGASDLDEIKEGVQCLRAAGASELALLHCISSYPAGEEEANLAAIRTLAAEFGCVSGFSDHTESLHIGGLARAAGASIIEKHLTLSRGRKGPDHAFSLEPPDMADYIRDLRRVERILGNGQIGPTAAQRDVRTLARSSVVTACPIRAGQEITRIMLASKRPGGGISPMEIEKVIGRRARKDLPPDMLLSWDVLL